MHGIARGLHSQHALRRVRADNMQMNFRAELNQLGHHFVDKPDQPIDIRWMIKPGNKKNIVFARRAINGYRNRVEDIQR